VIATFDCDLLLARSCEFAIKWLQACFSRHSFRIATHTFFVAMASFDRRHFFSHCSKASTTAGSSKLLETSKACLALAISSSAKPVRSTFSCERMDMVVLRARLWRV